MCGSKSFNDKILELESSLKAMGHEVIIPREIIETMTKRESCILHFDEITKNDVDALLVINEPKNGKQNYIGANTFAEIAFGFYFRKNIYLLNDMYEPYMEELIAWDAIPLQKDMSIFMKKEGNKNETK
jgi:hypothetical protein